MTGTGRVIRRIVWIAAMTAILEVSKFALNAIANVELVTLLFMVFTKQFGWKDTMASAFLFALLESMWWGISIWTVTYFYVWPLLVIIAWFTRKEESVLIQSCISGVYGLLFGLLCSLTTLVMSGLNAALAWWIAGIPYDLIHGISNFILCFLLYKPLIRALSHFRTA